MIRVVLDRVRRYLRELCGNPEDSPFDGLEEITGDQFTDDGIDTSEAERTTAQGPSPNPAHSDVEAEPAKENYEARGVCRSKRTKKRKRSMS